MSKRKPVLVIDPSDGRKALYLFTVPDKVRPGLVLVHNQVRPVAKRAGTRGSRFWLQAPDDRLERCTCGWATPLAEHYRVKPRAGPTP